MFTEISLIDWHKLDVAFYRIDKMLESAQSMAKNDPNKTKLIFWGGGDGLITEMDKLADLATEIKRTTNIKDIALLIGSMCVDSTFDTYNDCVVERGWKDLLLIVDNTWETIVANKITDDYVVFDSSPKVKNKLLLFFNGESRPDRGVMIANFLKDKLIDRSYVSAYHNVDLYNNLWFTKNGNKATENDTGLTSELLQILNDNKHLFPIEVSRTNYGTPDTNSYHPLDDAAYYNDSYFSLIHETIFYKESFNGFGHIPTLFLTEKTYKTIAAKHPFIIAQRPGILSALHSEGYKTFSPYIDETYDTIDNDRDRLNAIYNEVLRLSYYTDEEWLEFQHNVKDIVDHNYELLRTRTKSRPRIRQ